MLDSKDFQTVIAQLDETEHSYTVRYYDHGKWIKTSVFPKKSYKRHHVVKEIDYFITQMENWHRRQHANMA